MRMYARRRRRLMKPRWSHGTVGMILAIGLPRCRMCTKRSRPSALRIGASALDLNEICVRGLRIADGRSSSPG
jgi:hypothetical protein